MPSRVGIFGIFVKNTVFLLMVLGIVDCYGNDSGSVVRRLLVGQTTADKRNIVNNVAPVHSKNVVSKSHILRLIKGDKEKSFTDTLRVDRKEKKQTMLNNHKSAAIDLDNFGQPIGITKKFVREWLAFLAYMEVGGEIESFRRFPTLSHSKYKTAMSLSQSNKKPAPLSTACGPWGITDAAFADVVLKRQLIVETLSDSASGSDVISMLERGSEEGILQEMSLTALFYHRLAMTYRKVEEIHPVVSHQYFLLAYSCHYNPKKDILSEKQKNRVKEWFGYSNSQRMRFALIN